MPLPVAVSLTRRADPAHTRETTAWIRAGTTMAESFPGFLGAGWVRPRDGSDEWHVLSRFADQQALGLWGGDAERAWWLRSAERLAEVTRTERRTGIEGCFDQSADTEVVTPSGPPAPPRWKQATTIWLVFHLLDLLATVTLGAALADVHVALWVLVVVTLALAPVMTY